MLTYVTPGGKTVAVKSSPDELGGGEEDAGATGVTFALRDGFEPGHATTAATITPARTTPVVAAVATDRIRRGASTTRSFSHSRPRRPSKPPVREAQLTVMASLLSRIHCSGALLCTPEAAMRPTRLLISLVAIVTLLAGGISQAEPVPSTDADSFTFVGTGITDPGIPLTGCRSNTESYFNGLLSIDAGDDAGSYVVGYNSFSTVCESITYGHGQGTFYTSPNDLYYDTTAMSYDRTDTTMTLAGQIALAGHVHVITAGLCQFSFTSFNPSSTYQMECTGLLTP